MCPSVQSSSMKFSSFPNQSQLCESNESIRQNQFRADPSERAQFHSHVHKQVGPACSQEHHNPEWHATAGETSRVS